MIDWDFVPNRYDSCVVNKKVNNKQLTVAWHVDNLQVSYEEEEVLDEFIDMMEKEFGQDAPLSVTQGPIQEYLGVTLDFSEKARVVVKMSNYVKSMLNDAPLSMDGKAATPAAGHLFKVNEENPKLLDKARKELFVHLHYQIQFQTECILYFFYGIENLEDDLTTGLCAQIQCKLCVCFPYTAIGMTTNGKNVQKNIAKPTYTFLPTKQGENMDWMYAETPPPPPLKKC